MYKMATASDAALRAYLLKKAYLRRTKQAQDDKTIVNFLSKPAPTALGLFAGKEYEDNYSRYNELYDQYVSSLSKPLTALPDLANPSIDEMLQYLKERPLHPYFGEGVLEALAKAGLPRPLLIQTAYRLRALDDYALAYARQNKQTGNIITSIPYALSWKLRQLGGDQPDNLIAGLGRQIGQHPYISAAALAGLGSGGLYLLLRKLRVI